MIVTIDELEMVDALVETALASAADILRSYASSGAVDSLRNFIIDDTAAAPTFNAPRPSSGPWMRCWARSLSG